MLNLSLSQYQALEPVLAKAQTELESQLRHWIETKPDGELRFTAHKYRNVLMQLHSSSDFLGRKMEGALAGGTDKAQALSLSHLSEQVAAFSNVFEGSVMKIPLRRAELIATGKSYLVPRYKSSAARYAGMVGKDIQMRLGVDILKGANLSETIDRLVQSGGPRGLVALRGIAGEKNAIVEEIPEGLFARYRDWAERLVRTEMSSAYTSQARDGRRSLQDTVKGLGKKWLADGKACVDCLDASDQFVSEYEAFDTTWGPLMDPPGHPRCGCTAVPWKSDWPDILGDI